MSSNEKYPHVMSGPEHLELGLALAASARVVIESYASYGAISAGLSSVASEFADRADADGAAGAANAVAALAQLAQVHVQAAQVLTFATLAASEGEAFGKDWAELLDPDGGKRLSVERERAHKSALFEAEARDQAAKMEELRKGDHTPIDLYPTNPYAGPLVPEAGYPAAGYPTTGYPTYGDDAALAGAPNGSAEHEDGRA